MTPKSRGMMGLVVLQQLEGHQFDTPALRSGVGNLWLSSCCGTTFPMMHCNITKLTVTAMTCRANDGICSSATAGEPQVAYPWARPGVSN
ncbi:unnamed protein product [Staurois parvus]|uniref:Uncharacterized protein n=1 Tax=Staurois parvus TaxID=386267 RepID=A0ABN9BR09_9NEOB|nr:unnamed protein product [Staurois parvus]